ncbi:putative DNA binding domain-containing protein [bacterium]|nr:putative DNA binding domain-containing protein [bacterium]
MKLNLAKARQCLQNFEFEKLFVEELGWTRASSKTRAKLELSGETFEWHIAAELSGVVVFEVMSRSADIPDARTRATIHKELSKQHFENLIIFTDRKRTQSMWYWVKRIDGKSHSRDHTYFKGQPGDLFLSKLNSMVFDIGDFDKDGYLPLFEVYRRLKDALDVEKVTKRFYVAFKDLHSGLIDSITGIDNDEDKRWYASVLLNRLMFVYFLQRKFFLDNGNDRYLQEKLDESRKAGRNLYYRRFLDALFFEGFAKPEDKRSPDAKALLGKIKYLNGGLFIRHAIEEKWQNIGVPDAAFAEIFSLFERYSWNLDDTPGGQDDEINPAILGYIFEKYINQKAFGAYYTRTEITEHLCEQTIHKLVLGAINSPAIPGIAHAVKFDNIGDLLLRLDAVLCRKLVFDVLPGLKLLDPACGSGAFLVAAMKTLIGIYTAVIGKIKFLNDNMLRRWLSDIEDNHPSISYFVKKSIIIHNLFGVDLMDEAVEIAKLRLFLALVAVADKVDDLEPLPNIDFNIMPGNSLIGLMRVDDKEFERRHPAHLFRKSYREIVSEYAREVETYRLTTSYAEDLEALRDSITAKKEQAVATLNEVLRDEFDKLKVKFEEATWDDKKNAQGKPNKRAVGIPDVEALRPFHWGFEFDETMNRRGGFDAIITNPPWEIWKPNGKEFFEGHSDLVTKKKMTIKEFEKVQAKLLRDPEIRDGWLEYLSSYPHVSAYFRAAEQYIHLRKSGSDINLYKLFTEQCFNLLRNGGYCGIVIPSGIYTDLGTKKLRKMLFEKTKVTGLFCIENRKEVFEGVHRSFKFVVLSFEKGGKTKEFPAAFMRHDVAELARFPQEGAIDISVELVKRLSPDSMSVMEFKNEMDITIAEKLLRFPMLGEKIEGKWNVRFYREIDMTNDSHLFKTEPGKGRLPLYEGKMIWHFDYQFDSPRYWIDEKEGRSVLLGRDADDNQRMDYQDYRFGYRDIASSTNERAAISTIIPPTFAGNTIPVNTKSRNQSPTAAELCAFVTVFNSYVFDWMIRKKITSHLNMFYVYQMPVPRLTEDDQEFAPIVERAARLICTTPEFDDFAKEVGLKSHKDGATDPVERARLRAELDGLVAHLYGLTEDEFAYILTTFPLVDQAVKDAALEAYREFAPKEEGQRIRDAIAEGEGAKIEFKETARWDVKAQCQKGNIGVALIKAVASFLNTQGGTLFIGVDDKGNSVGLARDYKTLGKRQDRDGFENWLTTLLLNACGKDISSSIGIAFHWIEEKEICAVTVKQSPRPVYVKDGNDEKFYIRAGNSSRQLNVSEAVRYIKQNWC